jgi:proteasome accessory factor PafA2
MSAPLSLADRRLFGLETEYGILVEGAGAADLMEEARLLVRACPGPSVGGWAYGAEHPRRDLRGYEVARLNYDEADARFDREGPAAHLSSAEQRADRVLVTGARLYNDHGHPEFATPECATLADLVAHDRAGEALVAAGARARSEQTGRAVRLFKNNTDFHGASYGCHEAYLTLRSLPFERLLHGLLPFLVTRILFTGAGKTGVESDGPFRGECLFQLSQRADFFTEIASVDTLARRPIFNTRDEPHAPSDVYRRLHVICGDANLSQWATAMKVGTLAAVLSLVEAGWEPLFRLRDPVGAFRSVSRDPSQRWRVELEDGRTLRAPDLQRIYLRDAQALLAGADPETDWVLAEWERVLDDLEADPHRAEDRVDWVAKRRLLESYLEAEGVWWEDPVVRSLDLEYHNLDPEEGLFAALEEGGQMRTLVTPAAVAAAGTEPPATRAWLRGELVRRFPKALEGLTWGGGVLRHAPGEALVFSLPVEPERVAALRERLAQAKTPTEAAAALDPPAAGDPDAPNPA